MFCQFHQNQNYTFDIFLNIIYMGWCYGNVKTVVSQIGETGLLNDVGLCPKVEKEYQRKVVTLIFATKTLITFFWL